MVGFIACPKDEDAFVVESELANRGMSSFANR